MGRNELMVWCAAMVVASLAVAWLVERQHVRAFRQQLDLWGKEQHAG